MSRKEIRHQLAIMEQDRQFRRNAHIRQKIYGGLFTAFVIGFWAWLMKSDCVFVWYGFLAVPVALFGTWVVVTDENIVWDLLMQERRENG